MNWNLNTIPLKTETSIPCKSYPEWSFITVLRNLCHNRSPPSLPIYTWQKSRTKDRDFANSYGYLQNQLVSPILFFIAACRVGMYCPSSYYLFYCLVVALRWLSMHAKIVTDVRFNRDRKSTTEEQSIIQMNPCWLTFPGRFSFP